MIKTKDKTILKIDDNQKLGAGVSFIDNDEYF